MENSLGVLPIRDVNSLETFNFIKMLNVLSKKYNVIN
jgi:hypothetical protein